MRHPFFDLPTPSNFGHRGAAGSAPENTLQSFRRALELGAHVIESDVQATRDGVPVLLHDPDLDRTTNGRGLVSDVDYSELVTFDAAYHYSPDGGASFPMRGQGIRIPSLEEAFAAFADARFNLEIKANPPGLVERALDIVAARGSERLSLLTAGDDEIMRGLRAALSGGSSDPAIGASTGDILAVVRSALAGEAPPRDAMALQIPRDFGGRALLTERLVEHAHRHEIAVHVWTINDPDEMTEILDMGADGIITDHPEQLAGVLAKRS